MILNTAVDHHLSQLTTAKAQWFLNMYLGFGFLNMYIRTLDSGAFHRLSLFAFVSEFKMNI